MEALVEYIVNRPTTSLPFAYSQQTVSLNVWEIVHNQNSFELHRNILTDDTSIKLWLNQSSTRIVNQRSERQDNRCSLLRLAWVALRKESLPWRIDVQESNLDLILQSFQISTAYKYAFTAPCGFKVLPTPQVGLTASSSKIQIFAIFLPEIFSISWKYDFQSHQTKALCWASKWVTATLQDIISCQRALVQHPLFLALVAGSMLGQLLDRDLNLRNKTISEVETRTRYHSWVTPSSGSAEGSYAELSARMSGCAATLAGSRRIARTLHEVVQEIVLILEKHCEVWSKEVKDMRQTMEECVEMLRKRLVMQDIQIDFLSKRVDIQLTALFNLIAQKEASISISVAQDSRTLASATKNDSSAMKTLAAVTVAFLPSTFVAAFFSMPLFQWTASTDGQVVSKRFWVYWAVTVPLTLATLLAWAVWTRRETRRQSVKDFEAREELWREVDEKGDSKLEGTRG